jgi:ribonuclease R
MSDIPTKAQILDWIAANPGATSKRDIAKAFHVKGAARIDLKRVLKELEDEGHLEKRRKTYRDPGQAAAGGGAAGAAARRSRRSVLQAAGMAWRGAGAARAVLAARHRSGHGRGRPDPRAAAGGSGRRSSVRRAADPAHRHEPAPYPGRVRKGAEGGRIAPISKGADREWQVRAGDTHGARDGELVEAEQAGPKGAWACRARIVERLGDPGAPKAVSLIAIHEHGIPDAFPDAVMEEADACEPAGLPGARTCATCRCHHRPADARDRDDAVHAHADDDPKNPGGHVIWVAIADVAHYVRPGSALDREARKRGNSTYFPDRVVPMLPDSCRAISAACTRHVPRACLAVRMVIARTGCCATIASFAA